MFPILTLLPLQLTILGTISFGLVGLIGSWGQFYVGVMLFLAGAANLSPDPLLGGSIAAMIGDKFGNGCGSGVASLINGVGSLGAIFEGPIIGLVSEHIGWSGVIAICVMLSFVATLATLKAHLLISVEQRRRERLANSDLQPPPQSV